MPKSALLVLIGLLGGLAAGLFGIGGGVVIVPALIYWAHFTEHEAIGTSLAVLLPPVGLAAAVEYYRHGNVNVHAALFLAGAMFVGAWLGASVAIHLPAAWLRLVFGVFTIVLGLVLVVSAVRRLGGF